MCWPDGAGSPFAIPTPAGAQTLASKPHQVQRRSERQPEWATFYASASHERALAMLDWANATHGPFTRSGARHGVAFRLVTGADL